MLKNPIYITAVSSLSSLGNSLEEVWNSYQKKDHFLEKIKVGNERVWAGKLQKSHQNKIEKLKTSEDKYRNLDDTVLFAIYASRKAIELARWDTKAYFGINIGSSRGATSLFERYHGEFLRSGVTPTRTSPTTTLGNVSSWVAHDLRSKGPVISHSITCSTALHALMNGIAWIQAGLANKFLVGGSEAPLTAFTIAQMKALKIYSYMEGKFPCRSFDLNKEKNTMVLGEGASIACLEKGNAENALAEIVGIGYATEPLEHGASLSLEANCFQDSMKMALGKTSPTVIDAIVMHAPGTIQGDQSEYEAIKKVFGENLPLLTTNKWKVGHTFGASGMLSIEAAILMLKHQKFISIPFLDQNQKGELKHIMVNAVGFGGNAVSILLKAPRVT